MVQEPVKDFQRTKTRRFEKSGRLNLRIIDFGLTVKTTSNRTSFKGTPAYMPPEMMYNSLVPKSDMYVAWDERLDVWAVGCVLFEMFTGVRLNQASGGRMINMIYS
jgi:serine/threonine protein kinase